MIKCDKFLFVYNSSSDGWEVSILSSSLSALSALQILIKIIGMRSSSTLIQLLCTVDENIIGDCPQNTKKNLIHCQFVQFSNILQKQYWTFLYCSPFSYHYFNFVRTKYTPLILGLLRLKDGSKKRDFIIEQQFYKFWGI